MQLIAEIAMGLPSYIYIAVKLIADIIIAIYGPPLAMQLI